MLLLDADAACAICFGVSQLVQTCPLPSSTKCIATRYQVPLVNAGDLLHAEIASGTALGLEAKQYMDASKTVPDRFFMELVGNRLSQTDCQVHGWLLDGFPHTKKQVWKCLKNQDKGNATYSRQTVRDGCNCTPSSCYTSVL